MLSGAVVAAHAGNDDRLLAGDALFVDSAALHGPRKLIERPLT